MTDQVNILDLKAITCVNQSKKFPKIRPSGSIAMLSLRIQLEKSIDSLMDDMVLLHDLEIKIIGQINQLQKLEQYIQKVGNAEQ
ncbi:hypothetical protein SS50377_27041 [Spironucleus salmonicida]|uniref:Uncharacterized protein n=1 Tax=Spironucleus salmonicida TaxID=348837 RepID=V6LV22_9EUKA|nr:hypothetical protein SS50377_27041 [Spironucleus salmonicida]|eukprot:EST47551.1 Hypothetical protein SS50377_12534 [Spironucleus salmonicida]